MGTYIDNLLSYLRDLSLMEPHVIESRIDRRYPEIRNSYPLSGENSGEKYWQDPFLQKNEEGYLIACGNFSCSYLFEVFRLRNKRENVLIDSMELEEDESKTFFYKFRVDSKGCYVEKSFELSRSVYYYLIGFLNTSSLNEEHFKAFNKDIESYIDDNIQDFYSIRRLTEKVLAELGLADEQDLSIYVRPLKDEDDELKMMDFYSSDIEKVRIEGLDSHFLGNLLMQSRLSLEKKDDKYKISSSYRVDNNADFLFSKIKPIVSPLSKWPSMFGPTLMQAVAINLSTYPFYICPLIAINGPPGTGKTTLLKEIIADSVYKKAAELAKISDDFTSITLQSFDKTDYKVFNIPYKICQYNIVVASNNNAAVENISVDLPKACDVASDKTLTGLFDISTRDDVYFSDIAETLFSLKQGADDEMDLNFDDKKVWGLISAPFGKRRNVEIIFDSLFDQDECVLKKKEISIYRYEEIKSEFYKKFNEVKNMRDKLQAVITSRKWDDMQSYFGSSCAFRSNFLKAFSDSENKRANKGLYEKLQKTCFWQCKEYDKKREELFYYSLKLIEAFILSHESIISNLCLYKKIFDRTENFRQEDMEIIMPNLFNSLNLMIPVLSTTFASVGYSFRDIPQKRLGLVIVDEAGQATIQSAVGILSRARRCIIVGDPFQIRPVVNLLSPFVQKIASMNSVHFTDDSLFSFKESSLQEFANLTSPYYGQTGKDCIVGVPLIVHRRCISPMFDISNEVSYNGTMINATQEKEEKREYALKESCFINVSGKEVGPGNHYVDEQGVVVRHLLEQAEKRKVDVFDPAYKTLFIISPFKSVVKELRKMVMTHYPNQREWCNKCIGTVHTFQGKEADCVIMVLGCQKNRTRAAQWANSSPNILNVAVSRAKRRFVMIGDAELWSTMKYFRIAMSKLTFDDSYKLDKVAEPVNKLQDEYVKSSKRNKKQ